jgi:hypothetical protein
VKQKMKILNVQGIISDGAAVWEIFENPKLCIQL